jgi:hypothetical protein
MALETTATLMVDLYKKLNTSASIDIEEIIVPALIGSYKQLLGTYNTDTYYKRGDKISYVTETGELIIAIAVRDTRGKFNPLHWEEWNVVNELDRLYSDYIVLSWNEPQLRLNKAWIEIKDESLNLATEKQYGNTDGVLIYENLIISERQPTMRDTTVWGHLTSLSSAHDDHDEG